MNKHIRSMLAAAGVMLAVGCGGVEVDGADEHGETIEALTASAKKLYQCKCLTPDPTPCWNYDQIEWSWLQQTTTSCDDWAANTE